MADAPPPDDDAALAELLDSALADFDAPKEPSASPGPSKPSAEASKTSKTSEPSKPSKTAAASSEPSEAVAADLLGNLQQLYEGLQTETKGEGGAEGSEFMAHLESQMGNLDTAMRSLLEPTAGDEGQPGVQEMKTELRRLVDSVDASDPGSSDGAQNIWETMQDTLQKLNTDLPDSSDQPPSPLDPGLSPNDPLAPFMEHMLSALLSKEVLYIPLKGIVERYPGWLDGNEGELPADKVATYRQQLQLMRDVCCEFETAAAEKREPDTMRVFGLVQRMQELGPPPEALVGPTEEGGPPGVMPAALAAGADPGCPTM